jgi:hypothetical protein
MTIPLLFPWCNQRGESGINCLEYRALAATGFRSRTARPGSNLRRAPSVRFRRVSKQDGEITGQMTDAPLAVPVGSDKIMQGMIYAFAQAILHYRNQPDLPRGESREVR